MKNKYATLRVCAAKSKRNAIKYGTTPRALKKKRKGNSKINDQIKKSLYNWIIHHPQVFQSPIVNDFPKVKFDGHTVPQLVPKFLLQVSVKELHNNLVSETDYCEIREVGDAENNIIISDSSLHSLITPQLKNVIKIQGHVWL